MGSNNPYNPSTNAGPGNANSHVIDEDARLAAKLQAEEDARAGTRGAGAGSGDRGASSDYYNDASRPQSTGPGGYATGSASHSPMPEQAQKRSKGGFLSKLMGKSLSKPSRPQQQYASYAQQGPPPGAYYGGGYPPQQGPQPGYGLSGPGYGGGYGGFPQQGGYYHQQPPRRQGGGGMGTAGAAALGVGGGLLGGLLIADAIDDFHDNDDYGGGGDDYGGGDDFGGGDF